MLSELQRRLAGVVAELREADGFALAGGAALIVQGYPERVTADLDYFATSAKAVDALLPALESALTTQGLKVERLQVASGFARLEVSDANDVCQVDLGYDYRLREPERTTLGLVLSAEELAADKTLAVHSRALARDYVDLYRLKQRFGPDRLLRWATEKDPGFSRAALAERLDQIDRLPGPTSPSVTRCTPPCAETSSAGAGSCVCVCAWSRQDAGAIEELSHRAWACSDPSTSLSAPYSQGITHSRPSVCRRGSAAPRHLRGAAGSPDSRRRAIPFTPRPNPHVGGAHGSGILDVMPPACVGAQP